MSDNKRYYWLKLSENFFEDDTIQWIEEQKNGKEYVLFYLKLCLKSISEEGKLIRYVGEKLIPYDVTALSKLTDTPADTVAVAMKLFLEIGLVETLETGELYLKQIQEMIGKETDSARRMRKARAIEKSSVKAIPSHCAHIVNESDTEIDKEIELERELEIDKDILSSKHDDASNDTPKEKRTSEVYADIIGYLNDQTGASYKSTTTATRKKIDARLNEGYTLEDFKTVISKKVAEWQGTDMAKYLRPETLFGTKFESYLNQVSEVKTMNKLQSLFERYAEEEK